MPSNKEWGPLFWRLLHGLAERLGNQKIDTMASDEAREIVFLLKGVEFVMPCEKCRHHFHDYRTKHPLDQFLQRRGGHLRLVIREWLWKLHEEVNMRNGLPSFSMEQLSPTYKETDIAATWHALLPLLQSALANGLILSDQLKSFRRHLTLLRATLGV